MAKGINKVILVGNLGGDPEVRYTQGGTCVCNLSIATSEQWTDKQSGQKQERTEWHRVKLWGKLGETAGEYLKKGKQVYIEGSLRTEKYTDKNGVERYSTDIIGHDMQMLGGGERDGGGHGSRSNPTRDRQTQLDQRGSYQRDYGSAPAPSGFTDDLDDSIPF